MRAFSRTLIASGFTGLLLLTAAPASAPAVQMSARVHAYITFVQPTTASKVSDVSMGDLRGQGYEQLSLGTDGTVRASGRGGEVSGHGQPSVMKFHNTRDSIVNFVPTNYRVGGRIGAMRAHCALQATGGQSCTSAAVGGGGKGTIYIGMDMTVADSVELPQGAQAKPPSFDMSIVYQ